MLTVSLLMASALVGLAVGSHIALASSGLPVIIGVLLTRIRLNGVSSLVVQRNAATIIALALSMRLSRTTTMPRARRCSPSVNDCNAPRSPILLMQSLLMLPLTMTLKSKSSRMVRLSSVLRNQTLGSAPSVASLVATSPTTSSSLYVRAGQSGVERHSLDQRRSLR